MIVVLLSCLPLVKTTSLTTPCWDHVTVLPQVSVIPWTWRQPQEQEEQGQGSEAHGKGCVGSWAVHPGWAPPGGSLNQGDQVSWMDSSVRRHGWRPDGSRSQSLCLPDSVASQHHLWPNATPNTACSVGSQEKPHLTPHIQLSSRQKATWVENGDRRNGKGREFKEKKGWAHNP